MDAHSKEIELAIDDERVVGTVLSPAAQVPGVLFIHGWGGSREEDMARARGIAALGAICLTFDLRGHALTEGQRHLITRGDNLGDVIAAYDRLALEPGVDESAIAVVGASYGAYLAAILTTERPVKWLAMRVPALYRDQGWNTPKRGLDREDIALYRRQRMPSAENRALDACSRFKGDVLIIESEHDHLIPRETILSYRDAFVLAHSLTYRRIDGADHALSETRCRKAYTSILTGWATEMILGARMP